MKSVPAIIAIASFLLVTFLHLWKIPDLPDQLENIHFADKIIHAIMFAALSFILLRCLAFYDLPPTTSILIVILFLPLYAVTMEFLQDKATLYRRFEWEDVWADAIGIVTGLWLSMQRRLVFFFEHKIWKSK